MVNELLCIVLRVKIQIIIYFHVLFVIFPRRTMQSSSSPIDPYGDHIFAISMDIYYELSEYLYYLSDCMSRIILMEITFLPFPWTFYHDLSDYPYCLSDCHHSFIWRSPFAMSMDIYYELSEYPYYGCLTVSPLILLEITFLPFPWTLTTN